MPVHFVNVREDQPLADYLAKELGAFASSVRSYSSLDEVRALLSGRTPYCLVVVLHPISRAEMIDEVIAFAQARAQDGGHGARPFNRDCGLDRPGQA